MVTGIKDVAREVDMSTATVSRALRGLPGVSPDTRERVLATAVRLGYVASPSAAGLASGQTRTVAVIVPFVTRWFYAAVVQGAEEVLRERGYDLLLYNLAGDPAARHRVFQTDLLTKRVDAVLILALTPTAAERQWMQQLGRPVAVVGGAAPGWPSVRIDDEEAAAAAVRHLVSLGHRRIAYVGDTTDNALDFTAPRARLKGYRAAMRTAGLELDPRLEISGGFTVAGGDAAGVRLMELRPRPTAVFAASDEMAIGVQHAGRRAGLRVPEDVSVIGLDDHEMAEYFDLTTVAQPVHEQGRVAAEAVLDSLHAGSPPPREVILSTRLVVRGSTGPAPVTPGDRPGP